MDQSLLKEWMEMGALLMLLLQKPMWARSSLTYPYNTTDHLTFFFFPLLLSHRIPKAKAKQRSGGRWAPLSTDGHYTPPPPLCSRICRRRFLFRGPFFAFHSSIHGSSSQFRFVLIFFRLIHSWIIWCTRIDFNVDLSSWNLDSTIKKFIEKDDLENALFHSWWIYDMKSHGGHRKSVSTVHTFYGTCEIRFLMKQR